MGLLGSESEGEKIVKSIVKSEKELLVSILDIIAARETKARLNLSGVSFKIGKSKVEVDGEITISVLPLQKK